jgi:hypothetical protein
LMDNEVQAVWKQAVEEAGFTARVDVAHGLRVNYTQLAESVTSFTPLIPRRGGAHTHAGSSCRPLSAARCTGTGV